MSIYKEAAKQKLRINTNRGPLSVEQLYDLSQTDLATLSRGLKKSLKKNDDDELSFLDDVSTVDKTEELRFNIVKDIYLTKKAENEEARLAKEKKESRQKLVQLIAEKKEGALQSKSLEELEAMLASI